MNLKVSLKLRKNAWDIISPAFYLWRVFCLYRAASILLGQHYIWILFSQCYLNESEATLHKKIIFAMLAQNAQSYFCRKTAYNVVLICLGQNYTRKLPVQCWNVGSQSTSNFTQKNNLYTMFSESAWVIIGQRNHQWNVDP